MRFFGSMTIGLSPCCSARSRTSRSMVSVIEHLLQGREVDLAAGQPRYIRRGHGGKVFRDLVGRQLGREALTEPGFVELGATIFDNDRGNELAAVGIGKSEHMRNRAAGDL